MVFVPTLLTVHVDGGRAGGEYMYRFIPPSDNNGGLAKWQVR